jgi:hypothetical protein
VRVGAIPDYTKRQLLRNSIIDIGMNLGRIRTRQPPAMTPVEVFNVLLRLDSAVNPGLTIAELLDLLMRCDQCGSVTTRRVFQSHECVMKDADEDVVDLTQED